MALYPDYIENIISQLTPSQKLFCEYRSRGLTLAAAAKKAGSTAKEDNLRVQGHQWENLPGAQDYIDYLKQLHAQASLIDAAEVITKLRKVFDEAMADGKWKDANKAAELLGLMIGAFGKNGAVGLVSEEVRDTSIKENTSAFKEEDEDDTEDDKKRKLQALIDLAQSAASNSSK